MAKPVIELVSTGTIETVMLITGQVVFRMSSKLPVSRRQETILPGLSHTGSTAEEKRHA